MSLEIQIDRELEKIYAQKISSVKRLKKLFKYILKAVKDESEFLELLEAFGQTPQEATVLLCDDAQMREFQKKYKNLNRTTDVLSFPTLESMDFSDKNYLGDLVISIPAVDRNAKRFKRTFEKELYLVFTHGVLHLIGYEHVRVSQKKALRMKDLQGRLSKAFFQSIKK